MIYVDALMQHGRQSYHGEGKSQAQRVGAKHGHLWCHLFADQADCQELHDFAARLGMKRQWFQGDHYDLVPGRRTRAIELGAQPVDRTAAVLIWRANRQQRKAAYEMERVILEEGRAKTRCARPGCGHRIQEHVTAGGPCFWAPCACGSYIEPPL